MLPAYDVAAVVSGAEHQDEIGKTLKLFGSPTEFVTYDELTVFVSHERASSPCRAMAAFMRNLENARVKFDYIMIGDATLALAGYFHDVLEPAARPTYA